VRVTSLLSSLLRLSPAILWLTLSREYPPAIPEPPEVQNSVDGIDGTAVRGLTATLDIRFWRSRWFGGWRLKRWCGSSARKMSIEGPDVIDGHFK
jgi:hypothetical protein